MILEEPKSRAEGEGTGTEDAKPAEHKEHK